MSETAFILIVDTSNEESDKLTEALRQRGNACRLVNSVAEAVESIHNRRPDVIIADTKSSRTTEKTNLFTESKHLAPDAETILLIPDSDQKLTQEKGLQPSGIQPFKTLNKPAALDQICQVVTEAAV